jgi:hypothetical protein
LTLRSARHAVSAQRLVQEAFHTFIQKKTTSLSATYAMESQNASKHAKKVLITRKKDTPLKTLAKTPQELTHEIAKQLLGETTAKEVIG